MDDGPMSQNSIHQAKRKKSHAVSHKVRTNLCVAASRILAGGTIPPTESHPDAASITRKGILFVDGYLVWPNKPLVLKNSALHNAANLGSESRSLQRRSQLNRKRVFSWVSPSPSVFSLVPVTTGTGAHEPERLY